MSSERGTGTLSSMIAVPVVITFLLFAAQLLVHLHSASVVSTLAREAAGEVARTMEVGGAAETASAEAVLRSRLGNVGETADILWSIDDRGDASIGLQVRADSPAMLPSGVLRSIGLRAINRSVSVRVERLQPTDP